jgi:hypothetical protein
VNAISRQLDNQINAAFQKDAYIQRVSVRSHHWMMARTVSSG